MGSTRYRVPLIFVLISYLEYWSIDITLLSIELNPLNDIIWKLKMVWYNN